MAAFPRALHAESVAPLPAQFAATPRVEDIALSPDGAHLAIVAWENGRHLLKITAIASGEQTVAPLADEKLRTVYWASPEHVAVTQSRTFRGSMEIFHTRIISIRTGKVRDLPDSEVLGLLHGEGGYRLAITHGGILWDYSLDDGKERILDSGGRGFKSWAFLPDGTLVGRERVDNSKLKEELWYLEYFSDGHWSQLRREPIVIDTSSLIGLGPDGKSLIVYIRNDDGGGSYHEIGADAQLGPPLFDGREDMFPLFHPTTWQLCGHGTQGDWPTYHYDDPIMADVQTAVLALATPGQRVRAVDFAEDPRKVLLYFEGKGNAGSYTFCDFTTGDIVDIESNFPTIPTEWLSDKVRMDYPAADGLSIPAFLTLPPLRGVKDLPLIVLPHGGPNARDTLAFDWEAQAYAAQGYAVLQPNYRGSTGFGWGFIKAGFGEYGRKMQTDLSDGVRHLTAQGIIDPSRVAIVGSSYGGYAALAGATLDTGVYRCAVSVAGVSDVEYQYLLNSNLRENSDYRYIRRMIGDGDVDEISPVKHADAVTIPILLVHGVDDIIVSIEQSYRMERALRQAGKTCEFVKLKGEDHWLSREDTRIQMIDAISAFLKKHNPA
ncbi:hypothetical protein ABAC460_21820 [Asticcacaulis sp. AC460]|uniref:alpha/beta hydrolase family protein n=1 Tax=Asticcacaulis sp. AC460 TaxID=1282360 RepID=UPI0003C3C6FC|nr:prolyl oligopeptidase family serine peptidase [Asticcacaulis sp. AC460]ESQ86858.1 hypothetical protein ABAC460_21820 [Asticcacaulis sp. AC460]